MKTRFLTTSIVVAALAALPLARAAGDNTDRKLPPLAQYMSAGFILNTYGKPSEIKPMKQKDKSLKVEQWVYRRRANETTVQTASNQTTVPAFIGITGSGQPNITNVIIPEYRLKHVVIYQATALLMINDQLSYGKQWLEKDESYD